MYKIINNCSTEPVFQKLKESMFTISFHRNKLRLLQQKYLYDSWYAFMPTPGSPKGDPGVQTPLSYFVESKIQLPKVLQPSSTVSQIYLYMMQHTAEEHDMQPPHVHSQLAVRLHRLSVAGAGAIHSGRGAHIFDL